MCNIIPVLEIIKLNEPTLMNSCLVGFHPSSFQSGCMYLGVLASRMSYLLTIRPSVSQLIQKSALKFKMELPPSHRKLTTTSMRKVRDDKDQPVMDQAAMSRKLDPVEAAMKRAEAYKKAQKKEDGPKLVDPEVSAKFAIEESKRLQDEQKKNSVKVNRAKMVSWAISLFLVVAVGGGGYFMMMNLLKKNEKKAEKATQDKLEDEIDPCGRLFRAQRVCQKEVEELCAITGVKVSVVEDR